VNGYAGEDGADASPRKGFLGFTMGRFLHEQVPLGSFLLLLNLNCELSSPVTFYTSSLSSQ
jgi:hypothetical protein